ncbi:gns1 sur4 family protein [Rutstroemia sp. NJR-2017a WRK4]|nr:gns1 sur4 family protein [Rutstroemia sp. NJR-2017a WRK4]
MASATVHFSRPEPSLFTLTPSNDPQTLPPPVAGSTLSAPPFSIDPAWYNAVLDARVPITIALVYAVTVTTVNRYNRKAGNKPWPISKTKPFFAFVVAHNILLAVYSAWTFVGMFGALRRTVQHPSGPAGLAGTVDSLCKIHGVSGLDNAMSYNASTSKWVAELPTQFKLTSAGTPDPTDLGRLWNEGLAFYGWIFYLSKFYEVLDTAIILAKGKRSSTLQTYHHAGAMMCMWSGMRYMSPPIWMFVFVNSGIHALMYTYYTLTAFNVPIPQALKRSLTTMQIIQFLVGASYAIIHSFVSYTVAIQVPSIPETVSSAVSVASSAVTSVAAVATSSGISNLVKKLLYRAVGEEGLAENVASPVPTAQHTPIASSNKASQIPQYTTEYRTIPCIDTSGQTFAIWLNVVYLTPLTFLFIRFFVKSYITRTIGQKKPRVNGVAAEKAAKDALKGVERQFNENGSVVNVDDVVNGNGKTNGHANGHAHAN